jgi:hypothetical protein
MSPQFLQPCFTRAWTDRFGSAYTILEGGTGSRCVLVVARLSLARAAIEALGQLPPFKGRVVLVALEVMRQAPLLEALRQTAPDAVVALEDITGIASGGPAIQLDAGEFTAPTGLTYLESGHLPAWRSRAAVNSPLECQSVAAGVAGGQGILALACGLADLRTALSQLGRS